MLKKLFSNPEKMPQRTRIIVFLAAYLAVFAGAFLTEWILFTLLGKGDWVIYPVLIAVGVWVYVGLKIFVDGGTWAATVVSRLEGAEQPADAAKLRALLLSLNEQDLPFEVVQDKNGDLVAQWKIADAKWVGLLKAGGLERQHNIVMRFDEPTRRVKAYDLDKAISWRADRASIALSFEYFRGISLWQYERACEIGLLYKDGSFGIKPAYNYRFLLAEMKNPIIDCICCNGWSFCPVMFFSGPFASK